MPVYTTQPAISNTPLGTTFPVIHSILDAQALAAAVAERYGLDGLSCQLISRGSNDIYRLRTNRDDYAVRVLRAGWRSKEDLGYELGWVGFLAERGLPVPSIVEQLDGSVSFAVNAPEGTRPVVVSRWLSGSILQPPFTAETAARIGALVAELHTISRDFHSTHRRPIDTAAKILRNREPLVRLLAHRPADADYFDRCLDWIDAAVSELPLDLPRGHTHGDVHFGNVLVRDDGGLALLDFDDCGEDLAIKDLPPFLWRNQVEGLNADLNEAFVSGYSDRRPLTEAERGALPTLVAARHLYLLSSYAANINRMGPVPGFDANLDLYLDLAKKHLAVAGFAQ